MVGVLLALFPLRPLATERPLREGNADEKVLFRCCNDDVRLAIAFGTRRNDSYDRVR